MAFDRSSFNLFGIDLLNVYDHWKQGWAEALQWPFFARFFPVEPVCVIDTAGEKIWWPAKDGKYTGSATGSVVQAVLLPEDCVLRQQITLPRLAVNQQLQAVELAVQAASPFPIEQTVWGFHAISAGQGVRVDIALAAREHVEQHLQRFSTTERIENAQTAVDENENASASKASELPMPRDIEVWASISPPVVLRGFGEPLRQKRASLIRIKVLLLMILAVFLLGGMIVSPVLHKRTQVFQAQAALGQLMQEVAPVVAERDALGLANERLQSVNDYQHARPDPRYVLGRLSALLPDSVYLNRFDMRGRVVVIGGLAENAAGLMELLGTQTDFSDLKAPSAISRDGLSGKESFTIEFRLANEGVAQ